MARAWEEAFFGAMVPPETRKVAMRIGMMARGWRARLSSRQTCLMTRTWPSGVDWIQRRVLSWIRRRSLPRRGARRRRMPRLIRAWASSAYTRYM